MVLAGGPRSLRPMCGAHALRSSEGTASSNGGTRGGSQGLRGGSGGFPSLEELKEGVIHRRSGIVMIGFSISSSRRGFVEYFMCITTNLVRFAYDLRVFSQRCESMNLIHNIITVIKQWIRTRLHVWEGVVYTDIL